MGSVAEGACGFRGADGGAAQTDSGPASQVAPIQTLIYNDKRASRDARRRHPWRVSSPLPFALFCNQCSSALQTRGMLEKLETEGQLASILAHEAAHITARHSAAAISQQIGVDLVLSVAMSQTSSQGAATAARLGGQLIGLKYSRENEKEADKYGMDYMVKAGFDPKGMVETMDILDEENKRKPIEFFSTHPNPENRRGNLLRHIGIRGYDYNYQGLKVGAEEYKKNVLDILEKLPKRKKPRK